MNRFEIFNWKNQIQILVNRSLEIAIISNFIKTTFNIKKVKKIYFLLLLLLIFSCTNNKNQKENKIIERDTIVKNDTITIKENKPVTSKADTKQQLIGNWKEHWGIGMETNVNSADVYQIKLVANGNLELTCPAKKKFAIDQVLFDGQELTFRKQNKSYPKGKFYVYYKLKLHDDYNWMEGPITNNKKQKDYVKWEKVEAAQ